MLAHVQVVLSFVVNLLSNSCVVVGSCVWYQQCLAYEADRRPSLGVCVSLYSQLLLAFQQGSVTFRADILAPGCLAFPQWLVATYVVCNVSRNGLLLLACTMVDDL